MWYKDNAGEAQKPNTATVLSWMLGADNKNLWDLWPQMCSLTLATESIIPCLWLPEYLLSVLWRQWRCFDWQSLWSHNAHTHHDQRSSEEENLHSSWYFLPVNLSLQTFLSLCIHLYLSLSDPKTPFYSVMMQQTTTVRRMFTMISLFCLKWTGLVICHADKSCPEVSISTSPCLSIYIFFL